MAVPGNTVQTFTRIGIKEDLADVIYKNIVALQS